ncbi:MAG: acetoacetate decarboxylase (ADC) [Aquabacterium sp.]|uniref:acetoacetate decarboxylase family protein n=1 Tax=Aquabacterium sp. TaxID=1872578 RepID=UPI00120C880D|nr:acetoacetate decarboxylase family protein [Aquabacterium sp.]TAK96166.1 MAG: acetoacetate decarboxylase (ADC) [Aquabacterium sp.]
MNSKSVIFAAGFILGMGTTPLMAQVQAATNAKESVLIDIAGNKVPVVQGGLYDRYRSNPPLSVIASEAPDVDLSWFKQLKKEKVDIGFESYSPNFYYKTSRVSAIYTADIDRLRALMPADVMKVVQPLQIWPGRGVVAVTAYTYHYCDNDSYNEVAISIVTNKPGSWNMGPISLMGQSLSKDFWGYVLKLPVDTELARVRGVVGYNLPKWLTQIAVNDSRDALSYEIKNAQTGEMDLRIDTRKLDKVSAEVELVTNSFTNTDHQGRLTQGYAVARQLQHGSSTDASMVSLQLGKGALSDLIRSLDLGKMLKYEYVPDFQSALYAPARLPGF